MAKTVLEKLAEYPAEMSVGITEDEVAVFAVLHEQRSYSSLKSQFPAIKKLGKTLRNLRMRGLIQNKLANGQGWRRVPSPVVKEALLGAS